MPYSGCNGWPTLRTATASSGAARMRATSAATCTPPRASPTTTSPGPRSTSSLPASALPASIRSRKSGPGMRNSPFISRGRAGQPATRPRMRCLGPRGVEQVHDLRDIGDLAHGFRDLVDQLFVLELAAQEHRAALRVGAD